MAEPRIWTELLTYGLGVALSPIHIVLMLLLLLGASPLRRGGLFLGGWLLTSALAVIGLLTLGHGLLLDMTQGSDHRTGLDLIGGGALIALGGRELIRGVLENGTAPAWSDAVDRFAAMPLPLLLLISSITEVISPDDLLLFAKSAAVILSAQLPLREEIICSAGFSASASALLLMPFLAVFVGRQRVLPLLQSGKAALLQRGELVVGSLSFGLGGYLSWQGISGLMIS